MPSLLTDLTRNPLSSLSTSSLISLSYFKDVRNGLFLFIISNITEAFPATLHIEGFISITVLGVLQEFTRNYKNDDYILYPPLQIIFSILLRER